jgi:hypothetical protein
MSKAAIIKQYVNEIQAEEKEAKYKYQEFLPLAKMRIEAISKRKANKLIKDYLFNYMKMSRVIGQDPSWLRNLKREINNKRKYLDSFKKMKLEKAELSIHKEKIEECYESFKNCFHSFETPVGASKILHILCPDFFPLWDNAVADGFRTVYYDEKKDSPKKFTKEDYYNFMIWIRNFIIKNSKIIDNLSNDNKVSKVRIVDECLIYAVRYPFSHIL